MTRKKDILGKLDALFPATSSRRQSNADMTPNNISEAREAAAISETDLHVEDEYEALDEASCPPEEKLLVKRASKLCNKLIKENSELFRIT